MPDQTPNLSLPFILPAQAQKHVTHNEAIELLDMVVQLTLESVGATDPPRHGNRGTGLGAGHNPDGKLGGASRDDRDVARRRLAFRGSP